MKTIPCDSFMMNFVIIKWLSDNNKTVFPKKIPGAPKNPTLHIKGT